MNTLDHPKGANFFLIANCALLFYTLAVVLAAGLYVSYQTSPARHSSIVVHQQAPMQPQTTLNDELAHLLHETKSELMEKEEALAALRDELNNGYVVAKDIDVTESDKAYWLSEPKLMLGVNRLSGGSLLVSFANQQEIIAIGQRIDFTVDGCDCFLLLKSSTFGHASFRYGCTPAAPEPETDVRNTFIDAKLN